MMNKNYMFKSRKFLFNTDTSLPQILETSTAVNRTETSLPQILETSTTVNRTEHPQEKSVPNRQSLQHIILLTSSCILGSILLVLTICAINRRSRETLLSERNKLISRIVKWFYPASDRNLEN
ncbi:uncharacterized protein LOC144623549 [Crassostrea virginica]